MRRREFMKRLGGALPYKFDSKRRDDADLAAFRFRRV
jgi:hypothetical protein